MTTCPVRVIVDPHDPRSDRFLPEAHALAKAQGLCYVVSLVKIEAQ